MPARLYHKVTFSTSLPDHLLAYCLLGGSVISGLLGSWVLGELPAQVNSKVTFQAAGPRDIIFTRPHFYSSTRLSCPAYPARVVLSTSLIGLYP